MPSVERIAAFLSNLHIFHGINDDYLFDFAESVLEVEYKAGEIILGKIEQAEHFYIIYSGEVKIENEAGRGQRSMVFEKGDYFGEEAIFRDIVNSSQISAVGNLVLLALPASIFNEIPGAISFLRGNLASSLACRELSKEIHFDWIDDHEAVYFVVRKHAILFWRSLFLAAVLAFSGIGLIFGGMWVASSLFWVVGIALSLASVALVLWEWVDWRNDYYVVTNHRVAWQEKVVGIHDSRQESIMHEIQSVGTETDTWGRYFDYGTVRVRTIVGDMALKYMPHPERAHILIEELWQRAQSHEKQNSEDRLHQAIIDKVNAAKGVPTIKKETNNKPPPKNKKGNIFFREGNHLLSLRFTQGSEIVYRKHFILLIRNIAIPVLVALFFFFFSFYQIYSIFIRGRDVAISFIALLLVAGFIASGWIYYQYLDWSNDIFKVSGDKIFDIDRKPFGDVQSRSAPLAHIESMEYKRSGIMSVFFNYGTVYIHIGTEYFEFENVYNPALVQQDINKRYMAYKQKIKEAQEKKERAQMVDWMVTYHRSTDKLDEMLREIKAAEEAAEEW